MNETDVEAVDFNPFRIVGHDGFGHIVKLGEYGTDTFARAEYDRIKARNTRYPKIELVQVLAQAEAA